MTIEVEHVEDETAHDGVEGGGGYSCKKVNLMGTDADDQMLPTLVHNWDEEYCSEFHPSYQNEDDTLKDLVADPSIS